MKKPIIAVVMPALNEDGSIGDVLRRTKKYANRIIVVNDGSRDNTARIAKKYGAIIVTHKNNMGLGASLRDGFKKALEIKADIIFSIDADGQHVPDDIPKFVPKIMEGYGFVLGERDLHKYPFIKKFGNFFLNFATDVISGTTLKDTESGFRCFSREALRKMYPYMKGNGYEIAFEIVFAVGLYNIRYTNVPVASPVYVKGVTIANGIQNFMYMLHRRKRDWKSYYNDFKYVARKWILRGKIYN
jgi:glycosyltransferase involved in cell wall biosynthesis